MDLSKTSLDAPPSYREKSSATQSQTPPVTLVLDNQTVHLEDDASTPLYRLSRSVTTLQKEPSSVQFDSVEHIAPEKVESSDSPHIRSTHLFYLVHPINARYRTDKPAYFATSNPATKASNFILQPSRSKNPLSKPEFTVLASASRTAASDDLFADEKDRQVLFTAKKKWSGERCVWRNSSGSEIAIEEGDAKDGRSMRKLTTTETLGKETMDALVAAWCLRSWYDVAESKDATKSSTWNSTRHTSSREKITLCRQPLTLLIADLEDMTPPESISGEGMKWTKRAGAMAGVGAGGGGL